MSLPAIIYLLCSLTALLCAWLLLRAYRRSGYRLLLWGGLCFVGLTLNNVMVIVDKVALPYVDLQIWRFLVALIALMVLLFGLVWDAE